MNIRWLIQSCLVSLILTACGGGDKNEVPRPDPVTLKYNVQGMMNVISSIQFESGQGYQNDEFLWTVVLDMDNNQRRSIGDVQIDLYCQNTFPIYDFNAQDFKPSIYKIRDDGVKEPFFGSVTIDVSGYTISLHVPKNQTELLGDLSQAKHIYFETSWTDHDGYTIYDYYPAVDTFAPIPTNGKFTDTTDDYTDRYDGYIYINMVSMEVILEQTTT